MPLMYQVTPLDADGAIIPAQLPYSSPLDLLEKNRCILQVDDSLLLDTRAAASKRKKRLIEEIEKHFIARRRKPPVTLPLSCAQVMVSAETTSGIYSATYQIDTLPSEQVEIRHRIKNSVYAADYGGQPFLAEWCRWPFGTAEDQNVWIALHLLEDMPFASGTPEYDEFTAQLAWSLWEPGQSKGAYITEPCMRYGISTVIERLRPSAMRRTATKANAGRRG